MFRRVRQRLGWASSRRMMAAGGLAALVSVGGGALLALNLGGRPVAAAPSASPSPSPSPSPTASPTRRPTPDPTASPSPTPELACPLNGLAVDDPSFLERPALAVQIENHPAARPARNLALADMVVEATVEGDVTRYTGIYLCRRTEGMTGPVRSARYYSIDLWQDLHVLPYFYGAGSEAIGRYRRAEMPFVNGITGLWPWFHRYGTAAAPHNLYTDLEAVRADFPRDERLQRLAERVPPLRPPFRFEEGAVAPAGRAVSEVEIWTNSYWRFGWTWNPAAGQWEREEAGVPHVDVGTGEVLSARAVVVQPVREDVVHGAPDPGGNPRRLHHLVGSGNATLYLGGAAIPLRWSRPTAADGTAWTYAESGEPVVLPTGVVWWEIVPLSTRVLETPG